MSMEVNGPISAVGSHSLTVKLSQQDKTSYTSVYDMLQKAGADKNDNWILDAKDFNDDSMLAFAISKGLIGRTWNAAIDYVKGVITSKKEQVIETKKDVLNERTGEYYDSNIQNGREISRTYYKNDENGNKVVDEVIYLEYDDYGAVHKKIYTDPVGHVTTSVIVSPDDETIILTRTDYDSDGQWEKIGTYEGGELVKVVGIKREVDMYGQKRFMQETYTKNGDKWDVVTEIGADRI